MDKNLDYIACPLPEDIRRAKEHGDLNYANRLIEMRLKDRRAPEILKARLRFEQRVMQALPAEYPLTRREAVRLFSEQVRDFEEEELDALRDDGTCDWVYLDGEIRYQADCVDTALRERSELRARLRDPSPLRRAEEISRRRDAMMEKMKRDGHARMRFRLRTEMSVQPPFQRPGARIRVHMPLPVTASQCRAGRIVTLPEGAYLAGEREPQRTAFWDVPYEPGMRFVTEADWEIDAPYVRPDPAKVSERQPDFDTGEQLPQIRVTPFVRLLARELAGEEPNPLCKARRFYDYITQNCRYRYVRPYFMDPCIPETFGAGQMGDCGMHALLFITLCRACGIPARWQAGLYTPPWGPGNHDWAQFYIEPYGWLFADGSFGGSAFREGNRARQDFYFGNLDPWRCVYSTGLQQEFDPPKRFPRNDPYDSQRPEAEYEDRALSSEAFSVERKLLLCQEV